MQNATIGLNIVARSLNLVAGDEVLSTDHEYGAFDRIWKFFYCGNLHKWLCAPKGSAFLFARPEIQPLIEPLVVSWGWQSENPGPSPFIDHHEWAGTRDISAFLAVPEAIRFQ